MVERGGAMARVENSVRGILDGLPPDDPERRSVERVLTRIESDIRLSGALAGALEKRNASGPPTPEQLANLEKLTSDELYSLYLAQAHKVRILIEESNGAPRSEHQVRHDAVMEGLETLGLIGKVSDA